MSNGRAKAIHDLVRACEALREHRDSHARFGQESKIDAVLAALAGVHDQDDDEVAAQAPSNGRDHSWQPLYQRAVVEVCAQCGVQRLDTRWRSASTVLEWRTDAVPPCAPQQPTDDVFATELSDDHRRQLEHALHHWTEIADSCVSYDIECLIFGKMPAGRAGSVREAKRWTRNASGFLGLERSGALFRDIAEAYLSWNAAKGFKE